MVRNASYRVIERLGRGGESIKYRLTATKQITFFSRATFAVASRARQ